MSECESQSSSSIIESLIPMDEVECKMEMETIIDEDGLERKTGLEELENEVNRVLELDEVISFSLPSSSNQDRGVMWEVDNVSFYVVCDGHGLLGGEFAEKTIAFVQERFSEMNFASLDDLTEPIKQVIRDLEVLCRNLYGMEHGGTTLSIFISRADDNWVVNLGDSEVILFDKVNERHEILSENHCPSNISEFKRIIEEKGDTVFEYDKQKKSLGGKPYHMYQKIAAEWRKKEPPKTNVYVKNLEGQYATYIGNGGIDRISMTRSIGDFRFKDNYGLSGEPYIMKLPKLTPGQSVIVATDGFWDCWKYSCVLNQLLNGRETAFKADHIHRGDHYFGSSKDDTYFFYIPFGRG